MLRWKTVLSPCLRIGLWCCLAVTANAEVPEQQGKPAGDLHGDPLPPGALARLGTTRWRHSADVTFVAFRPDGKTLLTAADDNTIRLWDLGSGKEIRRFVPPQPVAVPQLPGKKGKAAADQEAEIQAAVQVMMVGGNADSGFHLALAPDGKTLAANNGNTIQLWEVDTGKELRQIQGPSSGLLFSPDGRALAARGGNGTIFLWATETGKEIWKIEPPPRKDNGGFVLVLGGGGRSEAPGMAFTPDGKTLAAAIGNNNPEAPSTAIKFLAVASGKETRQIKAPDGVFVSAVAFARGGKMLAFGGNNVVHVCEADGGKEIRQLKSPSGVAGLVFSPDGKTLAVRATNQRVRLWETESGKELHKLGTTEEPAPPSGELAFLIGDDGSFSGEARALAFSPDGKQLAAAAGSTVRIWETSTGKELPLLEGHWRAPAAITLLPDGKTVVSWGGDRVIRRWTIGGKSLGAFQAPAKTTLAVFSPDGRAIAMANADNTVRIHDTTTGKELQQIKGQPNASALVFAPDGKSLAVRNGDAIRLYDVAKGSEIRQITMQLAAAPPNEGVLIIGGSRRASRRTGAGLAFSPDGRLIVAPGPSVRGAGNGRTPLVILDVTTGKELRKIEPSQTVTSFAFAPDGRTLATENTDRTTTLWEVAPNGRALATENANRTITLWEVASGKERGHLGKSTPEKQEPNGGMMAFITIDGLDVGGGGFRDPAGPIGLAFSPDGRALAVRSPDRSVRVWDVVGAKEISQLKGHAGRIETVAFAPNGQILTSGGDTTILLWDASGALKDLPKVQLGEQLPAATVEALWTDLAGTNANKAQQSLLKLATAPKQVVPFFAERLKPAVPVAAEKIDRWIAGLESEKLSVRQDAATNLLKVGEQAVPALQKTLASQPDLEMRKRVEDLLDRLTGGTLSTEQLRLVRAVEALERMGTPEARQLLRTLAEGASGALPTREAQAALGRLP
jgi:WD40 repeat protein